jgi:lactate dehydrogenase-like 2-hydroxyacid dehydrogenase
VTDPGIGADAAMMAAMPRLRLISCYGVGVDNIDLKAAAKRGITVTNTPGLMADAVADLALALMLASARNIVMQERYVRDKRWTTPAATLPLARGLRDKTIGILGLGKIGSAIAERASAFRHGGLLYRPA